MDNRPIGIFDSGIGGISVLKHAMQELPNENFIYIGDSANAPYGEKNEDEIARLSMACGDFLCAQGIKLLVMACNTATSASVLQLRDKYNIPVVSIEPAVKPALKGRGDVIVMATPATITQSRYKRLLAKVGGTDRVINVPCDGLSALIEHSDFSSSEIYSYIEAKLRPYSQRDVSEVVLGCTHYAFISDAVSDVAAEIFGSCNLHNGMYGMVAQMKRIIDEQDIKNTHGGEVVFHSTGGDEYVRQFKTLFESL